MQYLYRIAEIRLMVALENYLANSLRYKFKPILNKLIFINRS